MVTICITGCVHGAMVNMYKDIQQTELIYGHKIDIVLCCGDFQSLRNNSDLSIMAAPEKYRIIGDFWKYYSGELIAPYLTLFIGGNHEASNYLQELPYGGWVAPNIYYFGYAGVVNFHGLRIVGLSGIYHSHDYNSGHYEHAPYNNQTQRSAYHVRNLETFRMKQIKSPVDIVLSHDWPRGIYNYSNQLRHLLTTKPNFADDIKGNVFGSPAGEEILMYLKPRYWFSAHNHVKFSASVQFRDVEQRVTQFLALDRCMPWNHYLQILAIEPRNGNEIVDEHLSFDPEWLCILKATNHLMSLSRESNVLHIQRDAKGTNFYASKKDLENMAMLFENKLQIPENFERTAPQYDGTFFNAWSPSLDADIFINPQTDFICNKIGLINPNRSFCKIDGQKATKKIDGNVSLLKENKKSKEINVRELEHFEKIKINDSEEDNSD